ncbi:hypothetical protein BN946_scf184796.g22 [Trametes cinnabarina]|uniref:Topoisomerase 6 subunit A/Spo11 TOPRIM domain-containing protein n=1 Tax=Pycnoporus cinnabarinus TaxID=5643 RepID=A0A060SW61_PYCCI|nr:hypothetical protein BN946_scf184796.g22 [Trametes cinnabarina]
MHHAEPSEHTHSFQQAEASKWHDSDDNDLDLPLAISDEEEDEVYAPRESSLRLGELEFAEDASEYQELNQTEEAEDTEDSDIHDEAMHHVEYLVLSFLTQLLGALRNPGAYSEGGGKKSSYKKIVLRLADRRKEHYGTFDLMHEALATDIPTTKREVLVVSESEPTLIPPSEDIERFEVEGDLAWVLVVEKEAVFQTLCRLRLGTHPAIPGNGLIITGKGYPDVATRQLVKTLSANLPKRIPILALVDGDAYGIDILSVYTYGSRRMRHEQDHLAAERIQWLGLWSSELSRLGIQRDALIPITKHDEKKAGYDHIGDPALALMVFVPYLSSQARVLLRRESTPVHWRKELQHMLFTRRKAEIEVLNALGSTIHTAEFVAGRNLGAGEAGRDIRIREGLDLLKIRE